MIKELAVNDRLDTLFLHYMYFIQEFKLIEGKEWTHMEELFKLLAQLDQDLAKNPPVEEFDSLSLERGRGELREHSSRPNQSGIADCYIMYDNYIEKSLTPQQGFPR